MEYPIPISKIFISNNFSRNIRNPHPFSRNIPSIHPWKSQGYSSSIHNRLTRPAANMLAIWIRTAPWALYELHLSHNEIDTEGEKNRGRMMAELYRGLSYIYIYIPMNTIYGIIIYIRNHVSFLFFNCSVWLPEGIYEYINYTWICRGYKPLTNWDAHPSKKRAIKNSWFL